MSTKHPEGSLTSTEQFMSCHEMLCFFFFCRWKITVITDTCHSVDALSGAEGRLSSIHISPHSETL